jgi:hypothetical protein
MTLPLVAVPSHDFTSFLGVPVCTDLDALDAEIANLGVPFGVLYSKKWCTLSEMRG